MRALLASFVVLTVVGCATSTRPPGTPTSFQPVCQPCAMPCTPDSCNPPKVAVAPKPTPAPTPTPAPQPAAAPTFDPAAGPFTGSKQVTVTCSTPGAVARYTTDGTSPTEASPVYSGPIAVDKTTTINAICLAPGAPASQVASATYTVETPRVVVTKEKLELKEKIFFDFNKSTIKPVSYSLLDEVATALKSHDEVKHVVIEGHTDSVGGKAFNQKLSEQRAQAVRKYLVDKGIEPARLDAKGFGETMPVAPNKTAKGRDANRRVEFRIAP
jgi:outer membrane protein OmpA-like peptidoglycan-associated protein